MKLLSIDVGIKNLSYCYAEYIDTLNIIEWKNIKVIDEKCKKLDIEKITEEVLLVLKNHFDSEFKTNIVLIENQPCHKNPFMKTISIIIYTYFNILKLDYGNIEYVKFISATSKLKCKKVKELDMSIKTYKDRKIASIKCVQQYYLPEEFRDYFEKEAKKDDLADTLLLMTYYIENNI